MSSPFVAEIRMFCCNFAPTGWAQCNGQILPISQNTALFSLLGTFYGGNGQSTFALPNLQGMAALNQGQSTTGTQYFLGQEAGSQFVTLLTSEMPAHTHQLSVTDERGDNQSPSNTYAGSGTDLFANATDNTTMSPQVVAIAGGSLPHNNMQPYLVVNYCIALQGVFPPRT